MLSVRWSKNMNDKQPPTLLTPQDQLSQGLSATISAPRAYKIPGIKPSTLEEENQYQSASTFMASIAQEALEWKNSLDEEHIPAIIAILYGGIQIKVNSLSKVSFHGIRIEGELNGSPCAILAHQSTVQMLCHAVKTIKQAEPPRPIGFIWDDQEVNV